MSQYKNNPDGSKTMFSKYSNKGVCTLNYIFPTTPETSKKYIKKKKEYADVNLQLKYNQHDNSALVRKVFSRFLVKMLSRISDGELFMMPGITKAHITLKPIQDENVKKLRQKRKYADFDIVKAGFKIPYFTYDFGPYSQRKDVKIHVPIAIRQEVLKRAENRQIQWTHIPKTFNRDVTDD
jgi:hypothetical protein